ncbi:17076_t:CDS:2, partial [Funneliformis caledonium]
KHAENYEVYKQSTFNYNHKDIYAHSDKQDNNCQIIEVPNQVEFNANPSESRRSQFDQSCKEAKITRKNKAPPCKWKEEAIIYLLAYLKANKEKVLRLESRGSIAVEEILSKDRPKLAPKVSNEIPCHNKRKMSSGLSED